MRMYGLTWREAKDADGERIGELCAANGFGPEQMDGWEIDWSRVAPYWSVVEKEGRIIGAIQLCPGRPVARLEMLVMEPGIRKRDRGACALMLTSYGLLLAKMHGAQMVSGMIPDHLPGYARVAEKQGYVTGEHGTMYYKRVTE